DEYQDTSVAQTALLAGLFRGQPVLAVGDPKQSIYGWRGASAANMRRFADDFATGGARYELTVSWRNAASILTAANLVAAPLPEAADAAELRARPDAPHGSVTARWLLADTDEAEAIAEWFHERFVADPDGAGRTGAVLVRARAHMPLIAAALARRGVPHRVLGLGGLLAMPEIVDLNAVIRVAADEHAGNELVRLLIGARTELGLAELVALRRLADWLAVRDAELQEISPELRRAVRDRPQANDESASLVEALEHLRTAGADTVAGFGMTPEGARRAIDLADVLHRVRTRLHLPLVDLVDAAIRASRLDLETVANPANPVGRANLDAYLDAVRGYTSANPDARLEEFLDWLDLAERDDQLEAIAEVPEQRGVVQLTTMHSAKGLEWDVVAVPQLTEGTLPKIWGKQGWLTSGALPYPLRRDAADLPRLDWANWDDFSGLRDEFKDDMVVHDPVTGLPRPTYVTAEVERQREEGRRLAYVAVTRARDELLLTAIRWRGRNSCPVWPSTFLHEMVGELVLEVPPGCEPFATIGGEPLRADLASPEESERRAIDKGPLGVNPNDADTRVAWPRPPMPADRLARTAALAERIAVGADAEPEPNRYDAVIDLLLAERDERRRTRELELPERFGASYFSDLLADPVRTARAAARPMPQEPFRATLLGNLFHAWVEGLFTDVAAGATWLDGLEPGDAELADTGLARASADDRAKLELCQANFLRSRFAPDRIRPVAVELPIESPLGGATVVGKLDAVYEHGPAAPDDPGAIEIVDWKTGRPPRDAAERAGRELQLMLYAHAYSASYDVPLDRIRATLYYVADDLEITLERIPPLAELEARLDAAREQARAGG
ncbi:MAG: ATP-dependent helicase, partial [Microbacteriaceae bacterium]|nr:ATP-dependent helicase [Microbacteriaceae bacterium]